MPRLLFGGGINESDTANVNPEECVAGYNFELEVRNHQFRPRKPFSNVGTAPNGKKITGIAQLQKAAGTFHTLVVADDQSYEFDGTTWTAKRAVAANNRLRGVEWRLDDYLILVDVDQANPILSWNGTSVARQPTALSEGSTTAISITRSGSTATVTHTAHGYATGDLVIISGATETEYNGEFEITVTDANTYTYTVTGTPSSPATGSPVDDKGVPLKSKYGAVFNNRVWLANIDAGGANPHMLLASAYEDPTNYNISKRSGDASFATGNEAFFMLSPDLSPINGLTAFQNVLIFSTEKGHLYVLSGTDSTDYTITPFYQGSYAMGDEPFLLIGNDVFYRKQGNRIESLSSTQRFGDVAADDVSHWIEESLAEITTFLPVYDQKRQKALFFSDSKVFVYYKDKVLEGVSPWSIYRTEHASQFNTLAATYMRDFADTDWFVYWGDSSGNIYQMESDGADDDGSDVTAIRKSKLIEVSGKPLSGQIQYRRVEDTELTIETAYSDEFNTSSNTVTLKGAIAGEAGAYFGGSIYFGGAWYYGQGIVGFSQPARRNFSPSGRSKAIFFTLSVPRGTFIIDHVDFN